MNPFDLVGMAKLGGLELIALTDHNSTGNCPAAALAAAEYKIGFIPGAEITTSEEVHCVCLLPSLEQAMAFGEALRRKSMGIKNRPEIFGHQRLVHPDGAEEEEELLLTAALDLSIMDLSAFIRQYGGLWWPAHIDRGTGGLLAMLGTWPRELSPDAVEISRSEPGGVPLTLKRIKTSDAHRLESIREGGFPLPLETPDFAGLAKYLRG